MSELSVEARLLALEVLVARTLADTRSSDRLRDLAEEHRQDVARIATAGADGVALLPAIIGRAELQKALARMFDLAASIYEPQAPDVAPEAS